MKTKLFVVVMWLCASCSLYATVTDLDGTWYTGNKTTTAGTPSISNPSSNSFIWGTDGTVATANKGVLWSYFSDMTLANNGDAITLSFTVTPLETATTTANKPFRFGLFNDGGIRVEGNLTGTTNKHDDFAKTKGYFVSWDTGSAAGKLFQTGGTTLLCSSKAPAVDLSETTSGPAVNLTGNTAYDMTFTLTRNSATEYLVSASVNGSTFTEATANINVTEFNTFCMLNGPTEIDSFEFSNMQVEMIPEPATMALLAMGSLGLLKRKK